MRIILALGRGKQEAEEFKFILILMTAALSYMKLCVKQQNSNTQKYQERTP